LSRKKCVFLSLLHISLLGVYSNALETTEEDRSMKELVKTETLVEHIGISGPCLCNSIRQGEFPLPQELGPPSRWDTAEIEDWFDHTTACRSPPENTRLWRLLQTKRVECHFGGKK